MKIFHLGRVFLTLCLLCVNYSAFSQDMIARQAPVDRRLRAVDSVTIQRAVERDEQFDLSSDIYNSWVTNKAHPYTSEDVPDSVRIDLRGFAMPTPSRQITSNYGYRPAFRRVHKGLDIKVYTGDTIYAAFNGKVRVVRYDAGGYGNYVVIRHHNGLETIYGHLSKQLVDTDQEVRAGEPIGLGGNTGRSFGSHLHFETRIAGQPIDPQLLFNFPEQDVTCDFYTFHKSDSQKNNRTYARAGSNEEKNEVETESVASEHTSHYYKVKRGETLYSIAAKLGMTPKELASNNRLNSSSRIRTGQILRY